MDEPAPTLVLPGHTFGFTGTGTGVYGTRQKCREATQTLGGIIRTNVTKKLSYLVIGTYVTDSCIHDTCGRRIEKAAAYRHGGVPLAIIIEAHWAAEGHPG